MTRSMATALALLCGLLAFPVRAQVSAGEESSIAEYRRALARMLAAESAAEPVRAPLAWSGGPLAAASGCALVGGAGAGVPTSGCVACHAGHDGSRSHPVDVDLETARGRLSPGRAPWLRSAAAVVAAGVFLPEGKVTCLSCHDGNSPWKHRLAIPPDAKLLDAVHPGDATTYGDGPSRTTVTRGLAAGVAAGLLPAGTEVSPTPLCRTCHAFDAK